MKACSEMSLFRCAILIKVSFKLKIWIAWGKSNFTPLMTRSFMSNYIFDSSSQNVSMQGKQKVDFGSCHSF